MNRKLSYSSIALFARCPLVYRYCYEQRIADRGYNHAFAQGGAMHAGGEAYRLGRAYVEACATAVASMAKWSQISPDKASDDAAKVGAMLEAYYAHWSSRPLLTVHNEVSVKLDIGGGWTFVMRADAVLVELRREHQLYEMKTTSATLDEAEQVQRIDPQIWLYQAALERAYGERARCRGALVDLIKKPWSDDKDGGGSVRRRKDESITDYADRCRDAMIADPSRYFRRVVVERDDDRINDAWDALLRTAKAIEACEKEGWHSIRGHNCKTPWGSWCEYRDLCWYGDQSKYQPVMGFDGEAEETTDAA